MLDAREISRPTCHLGPAVCRRSRRIHLPCASSAWSKFRAKARTPTAGARSSSTCAQGNAPGSAAIFPAMSFLMAASVAIMAAGYLGASPSSGLRVTLLQFPARLHTCVLPCRAGRSLTSNVAFPSEKRALFAISMESASLGGAQDDVNTRVRFDDVGEFTDSQSESRILERFLSGSAIVRVRCNKANRPASFRGQRRRGPHPSRHCRSH